MPRDKLFLQVDFLEFTEAGVAKFGDALTDESGEVEAYLAERLRFKSTLDGTSRFTEERWVDVHSSPKVALGMVNAWPKPEPEDEDDDEPVPPDDEALSDESATAPSDPREEFRWKLRFRRSAKYRLHFEVSRAKPDTDDSDTDESDTDDSDTDPSDADERITSQISQRIRVEKNTEAHHVLSCADFNLYVTISPNRPNEARRGQDDVSPSRQYLDSANYTALVRPRPPKLRVTLFAPKITETATSLGTIISPKNYTDGAGKPLETDSPEARMRLLVEQMDTALGEINGPLQPAETTARAAGHRIQYLFMAPEWYFRRETRPLTEAEFVNTVEAIRVESAKPKWRDWLIVPGSIYWGRGRGRPSPTKRRRLKKKVRGVQAAQPAEFEHWHVFNTVVIFNQGKAIHLYSKRFEADIADTRKDFEKWGMYEKDMRESTLADAQNQSTFNFAGVLWGLEVCKDHNTCRLIREIGGRGVDVHLLVASNVDWKTERVGARDGGYFFYADSGKEQNEGHRLNVTANARQRARDFNQAVELFEDGIVVNQQIDEWEKKRREGDPAAEGKIAELLGELQAASSANTDFRRTISGRVTTTALVPVHTAGDMAIFDLVDL